MDWQEYGKDFAEALSSVQGSFAVFGILFLAGLGAYTAHCVLRQQARSAFAPWGVALGTVGGFWLWSAFSVCVSILSGGYESAWSRFWYAQPLGAALLPLLAALLALKHGYRCSWRSACLALGRAAIPVAIALYLMAWAAPNYLAI